MSNAELNNALRAAIAAVREIGAILDEQEAVTPVERPELVVIEGGQDDA
jgi:hypothetical protein